MTGEVTVRVCRDARGEVCWASLLVRVDAPKVCSDLEKIAKSASLARRLPSLARGLPSLAWALPSLRYLESIGS